MLKITVLLLCLLSGVCFKMDDHETKITVECMLRTSGLAWSRLTPALTVDIYECVSLLNQTE